MLCECSKRMERQVSIQQSIERGTRGEGGWCGGGRRRHNTKRAMPRCRDTPLVPRYGKTHTQDYACTAVLTERHRRSRGGEKRRGMPRNAEQNGVHKSKAAGRDLDLRVIIGRRGNYGVWTSRIIRVRSAQIVLLQCKNNVRGSCSLVAFAFAQRF